MNASVVDSGTRRTRNESAVHAAEETLIADVRNEVRPAQHVERKLGVILRGSFAAVSELRLRRLISNRQAAAS